MKKNFVYLLLTKIRIERYNELVCEIGCSIGNRRDASSEKSRTKRAKGSGGDREAKI